MRDIIMAKALASQGKVDRSEVKDIVKETLKENNNGIPLHTFEVNENGDLILKYEDGVTPPNIIMDEDGNLVYEI